MPTIPFLISSPTMWALERPFQWHPVLVFNRPAIGRTHCRFMPVNTVVQDSTLSTDPVHWTHHQWPALVLGKLSQSQTIPFFIPKENWPKKKLKKRFPNLNWKNFSTSLTILCRPICPYSASIRYSCYLEADKVPLAQQSVIITHIAPVVQCLRRHEPNVTLRQGYLRRSSNDRSHWLHMANQMEVCHQVRIDIYIFLQKFLNLYVL